MSKPLTVEDLKKKSANAQELAIIELVETLTKSEFQTKAITDYKTGIKDKILDAVSKANFTVYDPMNGHFPHKDVTIFKACLSKIGDIISE